MGSHPRISRSEWNQRAERILRKVLKRVESSGRLLRGLRLLKNAKLSVGIQMVGETRMRSMNLQFRDRDSSTDVLSFPAPSQVQRTGHLGDLLICYPIVVKQSKEFGHMPNREIEILIVHGVLHLLGFDHELGAREARIMSQWEKKLLAQKSTSLLERSN